MKTVGVVARHEDRRVVEIAEPFGVVAAVVPSTNPTSTAIYKILIALKARCTIVLSPHPAAVKCITRVAEVMDEAARAPARRPAPINWMTTVTLEGTQELMKQRDVAVILATGGMGLVRAAYSAGKPAYGVGPGNAPAYIERTRRREEGRPRHRHRQDVRQRRALLVGELRGRRRAGRRGGQARVPGPGRLLHERGRDGRGGARCSSRPQRLPNPGAGRQVGARSSPRSAASRCRPTRGCSSRRSHGVGRDYPLSIEKLCPCSSFYVVRDWREGCERCKQILRYGGMGHTMSIHSQNDQVILEFGLKKPAFRIVVNTPTTHGSIGLTTGLDPAMTLGCGGYGGNITSDNISPRHLLNIKRLAYEIDARRSRCNRPRHRRRPVRAAAPAVSRRRSPGLPALPSIGPGADRHQRRRPVPADRRRSSAPAVSSRSRTADQ